MGRGKEGEADGEPAYSSTIGAIILQGPHQSAKASKTTTLCSLMKLSNSALLFNWWTTIFGVVFEKDLGKILLVFKVVGMMRRGRRDRKIVLWILDCILTKRLDRSWEESEGINVQ
jgi:hypothetical protein